MEGLIYSYFFVLLFPPLCTNAIIKLLEDDAYDILNDAVKKGETLPPAYSRPCTAGRT